MNYSKLTMKAIFISIFVCLLSIMQTSAQSDVKLHVQGNVQFDKIGATPGRLILKTVSQGDPGRYGILFSNNTLAPFLGEDLDNQQFDFYSIWGKNRVYDAVLNIHGKATNVWGNVLTLTHDGEDGRISTDVGNILLNPAGGNQFVGVGIDNPLSALHVDGKGIFEGTTNGLSTFVSSRSHTTNSAMSISASANFDDNQAIKHGVKSTVSGDGLIHYGINASAGDASTNYGVRGNGFGNNSINTYGVYGNAEGSSTSKYGVYGVAKGNGGKKYGVYGKASGTGTNYAGYFDGDVFSTGSYLPSDIKLKENIEDAASSINRLQKLKIANYDYRSSYHPVIQLPEGRQTGLVAQDVELHFPGLVKEMAFPGRQSTEKKSDDEAEELTFKSVNYIGLIPHLIQAIQDQQDHISTLEKSKLDLIASHAELSERLTRLEALLEK